MTERYIEAYMEDNHITDKMAAGDLVNQMSCVIPINKGNELISYIYIYDSEIGEMNEMINHITCVRSDKPMTNRISAEEAKNIRQKYGVWDI